MQKKQANLICFYFRGASGLIPGWVRGPPGDPRELLADIGVGISPQESYVYSLLDIILPHHKVMAVEHGDTVGEE